MLRKLGFLHLFGIDDFVEYVIAGVLLFSVLRKIGPNKKILVVSR